MAFEIIRYIQIVKIAFELFIPPQRNVKYIPKTSLTRLVLFVDHCLCFTNKRKQTSRGQTDTRPGIYVKLIQ